MTEQEAPDTAPEDDENEQPDAEQPESEGEVNLDADAPDA